MCEGIASSRAGGPSEITQGHHLRRIGKSQGGIHRCRHGAVRLRQPATCNGNTREIRQITAGFYDTISQGNYGTLKAGVQYSYNQRLAFEGVGGAPKTDDQIVMTQVRYYPF